MPTEYAEVEIRVGDETLAQYAVPLVESVESVEGRAFNALLQALYVVAPLLGVRVPKPLPVEMVEPRNAN